MCQYSNEFLIKLDKSPYRNKFLLFCIDNVARNKLPSFLQSVPTIVVPNIKTPLVGEQALEWLMKSQNSEKIKDYDPFSKTKSGMFCDLESDSKDLLSANHDTLNGIGNCAGINQDISIYCPDSEPIGKQQNNTSERQPSDRRTSEWSFPKSNPNSQGYVSQFPIMPMSTSSESGNMDSIDDKLKQLEQQRVIDIQKMFGDKR